jgi:hypothetical protein
MASVDSRVHLNNPNSQPKPVSLTTLWAYMETPTPRLTRPSFNLIHSRGLVLELHLQLASKPLSNLINSKTSTQASNQWWMHLSSNSLNSSSPSNRWIKGSETSAWEALLLPSNHSHQASEVALVLSKLRLNSPHKTTDSGLSSNQRPLLLQTTSAPSSKLPNSSPSKTCTEVSLT